MIDAKTRTEVLEFEVSNDKLELKPGMYGNAGFGIHRSERSFVVPYSAVVTNLERSFVIRVSDGRAEWVDARSGISMKDHVEIFADLKEDDQLVVKANDELRDGQVVVPKGSRK